MIVLALVLILAFTIVSSLEIKEKATSHIYSQTPEDDKYIVAVNVFFLIITFYKQVGFSFHANEYRKLELAGVGVRVKKIGPVKVNVYSAALYLEKSTALLNSLKIFKGISNEKLHSSDDLANAVRE